MGNSIRTPSEEALAPGQYCGSPRVIVSFTSFPARIIAVPRVLETLYAQSRRPDKIILWLAAGQFPQGEADLPNKLLEDIAAEKLELRWCDNLGSHKKYYYAMQEYPEDIIVLVDDDTYYHPDALDTLYNLYRANPECIAALEAKLLLIGDSGTIAPYREWPFGIAVDQPSIQLVPMGGGGVLYPPHSIDPCVFDKDAILAHCVYNGVVCADDLWLKAHAILAGTPTVTQGVRKAVNQSIMDMQAASISALDSKRQSQHEQALAFLLERHGSCGEKTVRERLLEATANGEILSRRSDAVVRSALNRPIEKLVSRVDAITSAREGAGKISVDSLHFYISWFCSTMAYCDSECAAEYTKRLRDAFLSVPNIDSLARKSMYIRACVEHSAILLYTLSPMFQEPENYLQMLSHWDRFFREHPDCEDEYFDGYILFLVNMKSFAHSGKCKSCEKACQACRDALAAAWRGLPLSIRLTRLLHRAGGFLLRKLSRSE